MTVPGSGAPLRAIARIADVWSFDIISDWVHFFGGDTRLAEIWLFARNANTEHLLDEAALAARYRRTPVAPADCRPVKIGTIAAALGIEYEAVRRKIAALRDVGGCVLDNQGVIVLLPDSVGAAVAAHGGGLPMRLAMLATRLRTLILDNGYDAAAVAELHDALDIDFAGLANAETLANLAVGQYLARTLLADTFLFGADRDSAAIYFTIYVESERALADDPQLSREDGWIESERPDRALQPMTVRAVAQRIGMPTETVRRKINRLVDKGLIERVADGVVVMRTTDIFQAHATRVYGNLLTTLAAVRRIAALPPA